jgi:hypothetical protein
MWIEDVLGGTLSRGERDGKGRSEGEQTKVKKLERRRGKVE